MMPIAQRAALKLALLLSLTLAAVGVRAQAYSPAATPLNDLQAAIETFNGARQLAKTNPHVVANVVAYAQAGMTMSTVACNAWLHSLGKSDRDSSFWKGMLNIVGNLILGVSAINGASSDSLARGALGMSAVNGGFDTWRQEILMGVIEEISPKIKEGLRVAEAAQLANIEKAGYDLHSVHRRLMDYHDICSRVEIRRLLKEGMSAVRYTVGDSLLSSATGQARVDLLAGDIFRTLYPRSDTGIAALTATDLYHLWVALIAYPSDSATTYINNIKNSAVMKLHVASLGAISTADRERVIRNLHQIAELSGFAKKLETELANSRENDAMDKEAKAVDRMMRLRDQVAQHESELREALKTHGSVSTDTSARMQYMGPQDLDRLLKAIEDMSRSPAETTMQDGKVVQRRSEPLSPADRDAIEGSIQVLRQSIIDLQKQTDDVDRAKSEAMSVRSTVARARGQSSYVPLELRIVPVGRP